MKFERVMLADGAADQGLIPGVEPVSLAKRQIAKLEADRAKRRAINAQVGGLFNFTERNQTELF